MVRELNEADLDEVIVLLKELSPYPVEPDREMLRAKIIEMRSLEHMKAFGYEGDGTIVGMCTAGRVEGLSKDCRPFTVIENVVVLEAMRRKGIGKRLVRRAIHQAENWGSYKVILETGTKREWKLRFYEDCGLTSGDKTGFMKRFGGRRPAIDAT